MSRSTASTASGAAVEHRDGPYGEWDLPGAVDGGRHDVPVHVALLGGGVVDPLVARAEVGNFGCVYRDQYPPAAQHYGGDLPEDLVEPLGVAHSYFPQLEGHRVEIHIKWPRGGRHGVIGDSSTRQDPGERHSIDLVAAYGAWERPRDRRYA